MGNTYSILQSIPMLCMDRVRPPALSVATNQRGDPTSQRRRSVSIAMRAEGSVTESGSSAVRSPSIGNARIASSTDDSKLAQRQTPPALHRTASTGAMPKSGARLTSLPPVSAAVVNALVTSDGASN